MSDNDLPEPKDDQLPLPPGSSEGGLLAPPPLSAQPGKPNIYDPNAPAPKRPLAPGVQGPVPQNLAIAPGVLRGAAGKADEVYDTLHKQAASLEEPTSTAVKGVHGLQVESALRRSHKHWEEQAGTVTAWLAHISESLRAAADIHVKQDLGTAYSFGQKDHSPLYGGGQSGLSYPAGDPSFSSISRY
ncbi:hypothetical protein SBI_01827 [Streptomyces bingchenggensis BCW-1]|uniref:Uncharacterized protein n=1 Tax=Streptomyces bingchenggensis (strain BCW-1) TaxID=749414 RepID=D7BPU1_STRBB|nr:MULTISPECIES: alpha-ketoglutarate decarboxylase [Streptomyces]ADI04948.1 hypothetical protein SBI_01827 [Streptomyces bingchenggensis BCW-1]